MLRWTEDEDAALRRLVERGIPVSEMVRVLRSRTEDAIEKRIRKLGLSRPRILPIVDWDALEELTA